MTTMQIESDFFKIQASVYMKRLFRKYLISRWYLFAAIIILFMGLSFVDLRFIYVLLMAVFIVIPSLLTFVYFYYAFSEDCVMSIRNGKILVKEDGIERIFCNDDNEPIGSRFYEWNSFNGVDIYESRYLIIAFEGKKFGFIMIPKEAFPDFIKAKKFISAKILS